MLRRSRFLLHNINNNTSSLLDTIRSSPRKVITPRIFCATLDCPKQGLLELADDFLASSSSNQEADKNSSSKNTKNNKNTSSSLSSSPIFRLDQPPRGFPAISSLKNDSDNITNLDFIKVIQKNHLNEFGRRWHRQKFATHHQDRVFVIDATDESTSEHNKNNTMILGSNQQSSSSSSSFDEKCAKTSKVIHDLFTSLPSSERVKRPFALQGACFKTNITVLGDEIELRARCDLLHFLPNHHPFLSVSNNNNNTTTKRRNQVDDSKNNVGGCFELIQIKSQIEPDRDRPVYLKHLRDLALCRYVITKSILQLQSSSSSSSSTFPLIQSTALLHPSRIHRREPHFIQTVQYRGMLNQLFGLVDVPIVENNNNNNNNTDDDEESILVGTDLDKIEKHLIIDNVCQTLFGRDTSTRESKAEKLKKQKWIENETLQVDDNDAMTGSHCSWNCRFYKNNIGLKKSSSSSSSCPCFPSSSTFPDNIFNMPRMSLAKKTELWNRGIKSVTDKRLTGSLSVEKSNKNNNKTFSWSPKIAAEFQHQQQQQQSSSSSTASDTSSNKLSPNQLRFVVSSITKLPVVEKKKIEQFISKIRYPLIALDFEACQFGIPIYSNYNVYDHLPFQFSAHVIMNEKELFSSAATMIAQTLHREFIHFPKTISSTLDDPRPHVADKLKMLFEEFSKPMVKKEVEEEEEEPGNATKKKPKKSNTKTNKKTKKPKSASSSPPSVPSSSFSGSIVCHNAAFETRVISKLSTMFPEILCPKKYKILKDTTSTSGSAHKSKSKSSSSSRSGGATGGLHFIDTIDLVSQGVTRYEACGSSSMKKQLPLFAKEEAVRNAYCSNSTTGGSDHDGSDGGGLQLITEGLGASNLYWMLANGYRFTNEEQRQRLEKEMLRYCAADSFGTIELIRGAAEYL